MSQYIRYPTIPGGVTRYATAADLPASASDGALALTLDDDVLYAFNTDSNSWVVIGGPGAILSIGTIDSVAASANGASINSNDLIMQSASATRPGLVNNAVQSFSGNKTFTGSISAANLSGTNTGDVTLAAVGAVPNANGASLSGQILTLQPADGTNPGLITSGVQSIGGNKTFTGAISASNLSGTNTGDVTIGAFGAVPNNNGLSLSSQIINLQPADATHSGGLSSTDWNTFNNKQGSGNYITALTGDVTASGPGSVAATLATVNGNVGSFGTAANVGTFTVNAKGLITAASNTAIQITESQVTNLATDLADKVGGAANLTTTGAVPYVSASGILNQDATKLLWDTSGVGLRVGTTATTNSTIEGLSVLKASVAALSGTANAIGASHTLVGDFANTNSFFGLRVSTARTITTNQTDTAQQVVINTAGPAFTVPAGQTLTNTNSTGFSSLVINAGTITGGGAIAFTKYTGLMINTNTLASGTRKTAIEIGAPSGATNNAYIADNAAYSGSYFINSTSTNASLLSGTVTVSGQLIGKGTATNDSATSGYIGEYIESVISTPTSVPGASTAWGDATSISLTAGDWDVTGVASLIVNGATGLDAMQLGISTTSGNNASGLIDGSNWVWFASAPTIGVNRSSSVPSYRLSLSGTTTVYLKLKLTYAVATPQFQSRLSARRMR